MEFYLHHALIDWFGRNNWSLEEVSLWKVQEG